MWFRRGSAKFQTWSLSGTRSTSLSRLESRQGNIVLKDASLVAPRTLRLTAAEHLIAGEPIVYKAPVRTTLDAQSGDGYSGRAYFFDEDYGALTLRVERLKSAFAWSENPPTRTRRLVTNIRAGEPETENEQPLLSNFALYAYRGDDPEPRVLTGERQDLLKHTDRGWRLAGRLILLDSTVLGMDSLSIFL